MDGESVVRGGCEAAVFLDVFFFEVVSSGVGVDCHGDVAVLGVLP